MDDVGLMQLAPQYRYGCLQALDFLGVMDADSLPSSHPISVQVDHPNQIAEIFDSISYRKGNLIDARNGCENS